VCDRLRVKIRVPYHTLQKNVSKLEKLHQASDILRRTARFVVLARRLEAQMSELDTLSADAAKKTEAITSIDDEDEKERTIAKAALTIAELGM
jgi:conserved oligomeric Golgi complex subunit 5